MVSRVPRKGHATEGCAFAQRRRYVVRQKKGALQLPLTLVRSEIVSDIRLSLGRERTRRAQSFLESGSDGIQSVTARP
jgi:hypothetical protein